MSSSFIYVIAANENGPVKLGYSANPDRRLKQLQTGRDDVLQLHYVEEFSLEQVRKIESILHRTLNRQRIRGEWFTLPVATAILEVKYALIRYGDEV